MLNDEREEQAKQTVYGLYAVAVIDVIFVILSVLILLFVCSGGATLVWDAAAQLTALHAVHLVLFLSACVVWPFDANDLYIPVWFGLLALIAFLVDIFVIVTRVMIVLNAVGDPVCNGLLFFFDFLFLLTTIGYLGFVGRSTTYYGLFGGFDDDDSTGTSEQLLGRREAARVSIMAEHVVNAMHKKDDDMSDKR